MYTINVSIIIINYNTKILTLNCLSTIYKYTNEIAFEIIVVDNASTDGSIECIREQYPEVKIIHSKSNLGFGKANNLGVKNAVGEFIFFLNSDTLLIENSVKKLYDFSISNKNKINIGVLGCVLVDKNQQETNSAGYFPTINKYIKDYYYRATNILTKSNKSAYEHLVFKEITTVDMVSGADMFMSKNNFNLVNGFDENFFLYFEESDLQYRLRNHGLINIIIKSTNIIHLEGGSSTPNNAKRIIVKRSQNLYFKKNDKKFHYRYIIFETLLTPLSLFNFKYSFRENLEYIKQNFKSLL